MATPCRWALRMLAESQSKPEIYRRGNVNGTMKMLNYCRKFNVKKFIYASSCAVYGNPNYLPCDEAHPKNPVNPYGESKLEAENKIVDYCGKYGMDYTILRYSNIYGPGQNTLKGGVIAKFIGTTIANKNLLVFGDGNQTRDFLFVEDAAFANLLALTSKNKVFNIGFGKPTSINELCEEIKKTFSKKVRIEHSRPLNEIKNIYLDISLAKKHLNWSPITGLADGIKKTCQNLHLEINPAAKYSYKLLYNKTFKY